MMYNKYKDSQGTEIHFTIKKLENGTFLARILEARGDNNSAGLPEKDYDDKGALLYVCAVIFIYGFSIILMIGSLIKKGMSDHGVSKYMKDVDKLRRLERRQEKFKTRLAMQKKRVRNVLGSDRVIFGGSGRSEGQSNLEHCDSLGSVFTEVPQQKESTSTERTVSVSSPLQDQRDVIGRNQRSLSCDAYVLNMDNSIQTENEKHYSLPSILHQSNDSTCMDIPEVTVDLCEKGLMAEEKKKCGNLYDTSVVSAFILPTPPANIEPASPKLEVFGRKMSSSSLVQLQPLLEADEEAIIV